LISKKKIIDSESSKNFTTCFLFALFFLLIATKSSPLYPFNDWVDANASFTMGKAMMNGRVLYRDIFDHRGPLLYFLYGLAYIISNTTFLGVFIFEVISFSFFLFFSFKILSLYIDKEYALIAIPLLAVAVLNLKSFSHGGSPEEFCLPLIAISLFSLLKYFTVGYPKPISNRWLFINGFIAGCVLWIKFSFLGFWFGWMFSILISMLINKQINQAIKLALVFFTGMIVATLPWAIYFGLNHSIYDWINAYFVFNMTGYTQAFSLISIIKSTLLGLLSHLAQDPVNVGLVFFGIIVFVIYKNFYKTALCRLGILSCFLFLSLGVFGGGRNYIYYFLIFSPLLIFVFIVLFMHVYDRFAVIQSRKKFHSILFLSLIFSSLYLVQFNHNIYMLEFKKEDLVQFKYASIINQKKDATLLNYGTLDGGFYSAADIVPNIRFFYNPNIDYLRYPLILDEQIRYIREGVVDYIVTLNPIAYCDEKLDIPHLYENYWLIEKEIQVYEGIDVCYLLFESRLLR